MCLFCKIVNGDIPAYKLYEDDSVIAFLDISQVTKGHTLIISKEHYDNFLTCDVEVMKHVYEVAQIVGKKLLPKLNAKGMNILSNVNEIAGQSIFHFHVHLVPRYDENDACSIIFNESDEQNLEELQKLIKE